MTRCDSTARALATICLGAVVVMGLSGCATNPATGKRQVMLISEAQEIAMGKQADPQIRASMGVYDDPELQEYVDRLGQELAARSERAHLEWHFSVLDDPLVNAFALPGGYIYITRGILAHFNSEAELAAVLGHEIGHVVARHSANQMSKQQLAGIGLAVGSIALDPRNETGLGDLAGAGLQLAFLKFGRDDERQADSLGLRYIDRAGYDPRPMTNVFQTLGRVSAAAGAPRGPNWFSTHPAPENRVQLLSAAIAGIGTDFDGRPVRRNEYLNRLAGMPFGENPREGFFEDNVFYHPDLAFQLTFPAGWKTQNSRSSVAAVSPQQDAVMVMTLEEAVSLESAEQRFFTDTKAQRGRRFDTGIRGLQSLGSFFQLDLQSQQQSRRIVGRVSFIDHQERIYRLLTYSPDDRFREYDRSLGAAVGSFRRLRDRKKLDVQPAELKLVRLDRAMSLREFNDRYPSSIGLEQLAVINGAAEDTRFEKGTYLKRVVGGRP